MSKHTPGPWGCNMHWRIAPYEKDGGMSLDFHRQVATVCAHGGQADVTKANARLIKFAPDMLDMLRKCSVVLAGEYAGSKEVTPGDIRLWLGRVDALIAKVERKNG